MSSYSGIVRFALEREEIRKRRAAGESKPWTDDPIMTKHHFCNVRRADDRVSKWLATHYYPKLLERGGTDLWLAAAAARLINWPPTLERLVERGAISCDASKWDRQLFGDTVQEFKQEDKKTFTGAYMLYNGGRTSANSLPKSHFTAGTIGHLASNWEGLRQAVSCNSVETAVLEVMKAYGVHSFISGQIVADVTWYDASAGGLKQARDLYAWAPIGPGSKRGLNYIHGRPQEASWKQGPFNTELQSILRLLPAEWNLNLMDVQNCACEFQKYERIRRGDATSKPYTPETRY